MVKGIERFREYFKDFFNLLFYRFSYILESEKISGAVDVRKRAH